MIRCRLFGHRWWQPQGVFTKVFCRRCGVDRRRSQFGGAAGGVPMPEAQGERGYPPGPPAPPTCPVCDGAWSMYRQRCVNGHTRPEPQGETRARRRIREAVESRGYKLKSLEWEPWSNGGEKSGICGGWYGVLDRSYQPNSHPGNEIMGLSVDECVAWVDEFVPAPEPCECPAREAVSVFQSQTPTSAHLPECRWHLAYWFRWWPEPMSASGGAAGGPDA